MTSKDFIQLRLLLGTYVTALFLFQDIIDPFEKIQRFPNPITLPLGV